MKLLGLLAPTPGEVESLLQKGFGSTVEEPQILNTVPISPVAFQQGRPHRGVCVDFGATGVVLFLADVSGCVARRDSSEASLR